jgi:hypothetical protein
MKVVINTRYGGFGLSRQAYVELNLEWDGYGYAYDDDRTNPKLVEVVEKLGEAASSAYAELAVVEIPDDVTYDIHDNDGAETVVEKHETYRIWGR